MQDSLGFSAIGWVHYRIAGGIRQIMIVAGIYAAILIGVIMFSMRISNQYNTAPSQFYQLVAGSIVGLQAFVLLMFGSFRVSTAIRLDFSSNMMESHRLMPLEGGHAVLGYVFGATTQVWAIALVNIAVTLVIAMVGAIDLPHIMAAHAILIEFAIFFWVIAALAAMTNRPFLRSVTGMPIILLMAREFLAAVFPGLFLFCSPLVGRTVFSGQEFLTPALGWSLTGQAVAGGLCFFAAARKYRQPEKPSLYPWQGAALLATWVGLTLIGTNLKGLSFESPLFERFGDSGRLVGSVTLALLLMIVPLASAAWFADYYRRNRTTMSRAQIETRALGYVLLTALLALLVTRVHHSGDSFFSFPQNDVRNLLILSLPLLGHALAVHFILRIVYRGGGRYGGLLVFIWMFSFTLLPLIADFFFHVAMQETARDLGGIGSLSPIGTTALLLRHDAGSPDATSPIFGASIQLLAGLVMAGLYYGTGKPRANRLQPAK